MKPAFLWNWLFGFFLKASPFCSMTSHVLKDKYICGFGNTENRGKERTKAPATETKCYCWFRQFSWHFFLRGNQSPITIFCKPTHSQSCCGKGGGHSPSPSPGAQVWNQQKLQLHLLLHLTMLVHIKCAESAKPSSSRAQQRKDSIIWLIKLVLSCSLLFRDWSK